MSGPVAHSSFSASSSARLLACPGSYQRALDADDGTRKSTTYSAEGTLAHSLSEICVHTGQDAASFIGRTMQADGHRFVVDDDFAEAAQVYVDTLRGLRSLGFLLSLENRVTPQVHWEGLPRLDIELFGTADCIAYNPETGELVIADLKFGRGVAVEAEGNTQLLYYASGAAHPSVVEAICRANGQPFRGVASVRTIIVQPRCPHPAGSVRHADYAYDEVVEWARGPLYYGVHAALTDNGKTLAEGKHCRFCPVLAVCDKPREATFEAARAAFLGAPIENLPDPGEPDAALPADQLSDDDLGALLDKIEVVAPWLDAVRRLAYERATGNRTIPGWKLVPKRATRQWAGDPEEAAEQVRATLIAAGLDPERAFADPKLLSPAQAEKALGRKAYDALLAQHVVKQSSGTTLAVEGDPRARVRRHANSATAFTIAP